MEQPARSRTLAIAGSIFALLVFTFFILRASLNLMNQRSDLKLMLGIGGIAIIIFLWGLAITKLMGCKKCSETNDETTTNRGE